MKQRNKAPKSTFVVTEYLLFSVITLFAMLISVCVGSVNIPFSDTISAIHSTIWGLPAPEGISVSIIVLSRLPRVLSVMLVGASLSLCGASMQGLLQNPLADGSTLGVTSGASVGAVLALAFGISIPGFEKLGVMGMAMLFAFLSLVIILFLAYRLDHSLSTYTIILIGVIFSMFAGSILSLLITFAGSHVKTIMFWTMGSLAGSSYSDVIILLAAFVLFGSILFANANELNAFAVGEDNARSVGVNVKKVKLTILITVSALIGVCVSISGTIGFVGLVVPHMTRLVVGPNHKKLLPATMFSGATFLCLADLLARIVLRPLELPIGVVTSFIGSIVFVYIFYAARRRK